MLEPFSGTKIVTYHKTFSYFVKRFNLNVVGELEPKPGVPPSPAHINNIIQMMKNYGVKLVIIEPFRERKTPEFVASQTGAKVVAFSNYGRRSKRNGRLSKPFDYTINQIVSALKTKSQ